MGQLLDVFSSGSATEKREVDVKPGKLDCLFNILFF
jgi:hypothetical protein